MAVDSQPFLVQGLTSLLGGLLGVSLGAWLTGLYKIKGEITGRAEKMDARPAGDGVQRPLRSRFPPRLRPSVRPRSSPPYPGISLRSRSNLPTLWGSWIT
jgi:hypothetical protein